MRRVLQYCECEDLSHFLVVSNWTTLVLSDFVILTRQTYQYCCQLDHCLLFQLQLSKIAEHFLVIFFAACYYHYHVYNITSIWDRDLHKKKKQL